MNSKIKAPLNVFSYGYDRRKIKCLFKNIAQFFRNIKYAWQRAVCGYCDYDVWNLDHYYSELLPNTLRYLADTTVGHPYQCTMEEWQAILYRIANKIQYSAESNFPTPYGDKYFDMIDTYFTHQDNTVHLETRPSENCTQEQAEKARELMLAEFDANQRAAQNNLKEGLELLRKYWYDLWD